MAPPETSDSICSLLELSLQKLSPCGKLAPHDRGLHRTHS